MPQAAQGLVSGTGPDAAPRRPAASEALPKVSALYDMLLQPPAPPAHGRPGIRVLHRRVPGRLRLALPALRGHPALGAVIERGLGALEGVQRVSANPLTGRVLVCFLPGGPAPGTLLCCLEQMLQGGAASSDAAAPDAPAGAATQAPAWHSMEVAAVAARLRSSASRGLEDAEAAARLRAVGPNRLPAPPVRSSTDILLRQFHSLPVLLLGGSALLSLLSGAPVEAAVVLGVVGINAAIGFFTEREAERTLRGLERRAPVRARALRAGRLRSLAAETLVPGDLLLLAQGQYVSADARLVQARDLTVDESPLTGESLPVDKGADSLCAPGAPLSRRTDMLYMGTRVTGGHGLALVVATGAGSELGALQRLAGGARRPQTAMQRQLGQLGNEVALLSLAIVALVFLIGVLRGYAPLDMVRSAVSLAVAAVPEDLPAVATTTLALGVRAMRRRRVLVRTLGAVESLGAVQVVCLDKTGTLTVNRMAVLALHVGGRRVRLDNQDMLPGGELCDPAQEPDLARLLEVAALCSDAALGRGAGGRPGAVGSPTEAALVDCALHAGMDVDALRGRYPRRDVRYRAEGRNWMSTLHTRPDGDSLLAVKGSPDEVLALCSAYAEGGEPRRLGSQARARIGQQNEQMAGQALRVLGFACAVRGPGEETEFSGLTWLGLAGLADPLRPGAAACIRRFQAAGIHTTLITGDQSATAGAVGRALRLAGGEGLRLLDGSELARLQPELLAALAEQVHVFSRVSPAHKLEIVQALQRSGRVVAMTGDGINDGPALKAADVGVAMGRGGTDFARDLADVVLEDDELRTLVTAVGEGRRLYANIRKAVHFLTATNLSEIWVMLAGLLSGLGQPVGPLQLLWVNLLTDVFPALALAVEPAEPGLLSRPPRDPARPLVGRAELSRWGRESGVIAAGALGALLLARLRHGPGPRARSVAFNALTTAQLLHALLCRDDPAPGRLRRPGNPWLLTAVGGALGLQAGALAVPGLRRLLALHRPDALDLALVGAAAGLPLLLNHVLGRSGAMDPSQRAGDAR